jgi:hypothetical protein
MNDDHGRTPRTPGIDDRMLLGSTPGVPAMIE